MKSVLRLLAIVVVLCAIPMTLAGTTNCGNGQYEPQYGEECDDADGDCCSGCRFVSSGTLCRASQGDCDQADYCTGASATCYDDLYNGTLCRDTNGLCDEPEYCDGSSLDCPSDEYSFETLCRQAAGQCDVPEFCDGGSPDCPSDQVDQGSLCRLQDGDCDQPEFCDGGSVDCPPDVYASGNVCRFAAHSCDVEETCTGDSTDCPPDAIADDGASCDDEDSCTVEDACDGGSCAGHEPAEVPECVPAPAGLVSWWPGEGTPEDIVGDNDGTLLNETTYDPGGRVNQAFTLDGSGDGILVGDRPTLRLTTALTIDAWIRPISVPNGLLSAIVSKWFQGPQAAYLFTIEPIGTDLFQLHAFFHLASGAEPSIAGGELQANRWTHVAVTFDSTTSFAQLWINGQVVASASIATEPLGAGAADFSIGFENDFVERYFHGLIDEVEVFGRALTSPELLAIHDACGGGKCRSCDADADCDDQNECTQDRCVAPSCVHEPADGEDCSDGNACTAFDVCRGGQCVCGLSDLGCLALLGEPCASCTVECDDGIACTIDSCDPEVGCVFTPHNSPCDDQKPCTDDICVPGTGCTYTPNDASSCSDGDHCDLERCSDGQCVITAVDCDDHNACTLDVCHYETGCAHSPISCDDSNACTADSCDPATGCKYTQKVCDDHNKCTVNSCDPASGNCVFTPKVCAASDGCHTAGTCNPSTGVCSNPTRPNGTTCDDGNACTRTDSCQYGSCRGSNAVTCKAQDSCHSAGVCDPSSGQCSNPAKPNGTTCSDGTLCTKYDKCQAGVCTGTAVVCAPPDSCHDPGTCNPSTGYCSNPAKPNGSTCSDGNACTRVDTCNAGSCRGSDPVVCTASDPCHKAGVCSPSTGVCSDPIKPNGSSCSDGNSCTVSDTCWNGACRPGSPPRCSPCTLNGDATVKQSNQYSNFGYSSELQARGTTPTWALLRFHVTGVTGQPVTGVHVKLTVKSASATSGGSLHRVPCTWYEGSVTWSSKPTLGPSLASLGAVVQGQVVNFNVTSVVTADGDYCFAIDNPAGANVLYYSREAPSGRPQILVDAGCVCVP